MAILGKTTMTEGVVAGTLSVSGDINGSSNCFVKNNLCCGGILGNDDSDGNLNNYGPILSLGDGLDRQLIFEGGFSSLEGVCQEDNDESLILVSNQFHFVGNLESDIPTNRDYVGFKKTTVNIHGNLKTDDLSVTNGILDNQLLWSANNVNNLSPIDMSICSYSNANRLAFAKPAGITVEYSTNGGSTWTDYGASDGQKQQLVTYKDTAKFALGKKTSGYTTTSDRLRITLNAVSMGVYTDMKKFFVYFSTGSGTCRMKCEYQLFTDSTSTWNTHISDVAISGDTGWNAYAFDLCFGGFSASETRAYIRNLRLTFWQTANSTTGTAGVYGLAMYGPNIWKSASQMAKDGHLYYTDYAQHMLLPNGIYPNNTLVGDLGSSSNVWNNGYIKTLNITGSCTAPAFYQTSDIRKKNIRGQVSLDKCYSMLDKCQEIIYTLKDQTKEQIGLIAQEVEEFFPEVVSTDAEGYKSLDYAKLVVVCLKLIKDLSNRISKLEENG